MSELGKKIIDNLYNSDFYSALLNIQKLESELPDPTEVTFLYYYLYDLMEWVSYHRRNLSRKEEIIEKKAQYFNEILERNQNDKSTTYLKLYLFLEENFRTFEYLSWIKKYDRSKELLDLSLKENPDNKEAKFYLLLIEEKIEECFDFLQGNTLDSQVVQKFVGRYWFRDEYLDISYNLLRKYKLNTEYSDLQYHIRKKDYKWLYDYFNKNNERKSKNIYISYGKVCYELGKYSEAIEYYNEKVDKNNNDFLILGKCYEQCNQLSEAIECYEKYYQPFTSGYWHKGIEKLFKLKAYDQIKNILKNEKSFVYKEYKIFYEAKILNIEEEHKDSIDHLNTIVVDKLEKHHKKLKRDIYSLYIDNYFKITKNALERDFKNIIETRDFELDNILIFGYEHFSSYNDMQDYIKKINIEYENKFLEKTNKYIKSIHDFYIDKIKETYNVSQKQEVKLSEDRELYYLSAFDDLVSLNKRIKIYENRLKNESENPKYHLALGKLYYDKAKLENKDYEIAIQYLEKAIELSDKYHVNMNGNAELLLVQIKEDDITKRELFNKSIKDFIFFNSYQKDIFTTRYFNGTLYKYQNFSINALSSLSENYLYFATPDQLNDPFDVASISLEKQFDGLSLNKNDFKLCSLSKSNNNKLMWSHYTQDHRGICVGYRFLYLPSYVGKDEVKYKNTILDEKDIFESIIDYWTVKSEDWMYEKEVRLLHYGDKQKISYTFDINEAIQKNIIALKVESITFGLKFENETIIKPIIEKIEREQSSVINLYRAEIENQNLVIKKL